MLCKQSLGERYVFSVEVGTLLFIPSYFQPFTLIPHMKDVGKGDLGHCSLGSKKRNPYETNCLLCITIVVGS